MRLLLTIFNFKVTEKNALYRSDTKQMIEVSVWRDHIMLLLLCLLLLLFFIELNFSTGMYYIKTGDYSRNQWLSPSASLREAVQHPVITIETTDHFRLAADTTSLHVSLKKSAELTENSRNKF
jgi:hypothetical protein